MTTIPVGYKQTEIGVIPEDWDVKELSELTTLITNGFVGTIKSQYTDLDDGITYIQGYNVEENSFNFRGIKKVTSEFHKQHLKSCLQEGDLLTVQTGDVGLTTIVPKELVGANCHALIISRFKKEKSHPKYFSLYLNSTQGRARLKEIEIGTTMKHINVGDMLHFLVPCPTKSEQQLIATALSDTDALIESLEKLIAKKRQIKQGAMQELLSPKEGWEVQKLGEECELITKGTTPTSLGKSFTSSGINFIKIESLESSGKIISEKVAFIDKETNNLLKRSQLQEKDILVSIAGALGRIAVVYKDLLPANTNQALAIVRLKTSGNLNHGFLFYYLNSVVIKKHIEAINVQAAQANLSLENVGNFIISFPSIQEQEAIATILSDMDGEITALESRLEKTRTLKSGMMHELLTGRIRLI